jgi:hypothetical protein
VPATGVVAEAMVCLTLADFVLEKFGGDSLAETLDAMARHRERIAKGPKASGDAGFPGGPANSGPTTGRAPRPGGSAPAESE